ncbi:hypothetical protein FOZ62_000300, partial [Perkinsus olseni]
KQAILGCQLSSPSGSNQPTYIREEAHVQEAISVDSRPVEDHDHELLDDVHAASGDESEHDESEHDELQTGRNWTLDVSVSSTESPEHQRRLSDLIEQTLDNWEMKITRTPPVLVISVKRIQERSPSRLTTTPINIFEDLELETNTEARTTFHLAGVVYHSDQDSNSGHFSSLRRNSSPSVAELGHEAER